MTTSSAISSSETTSSATMSSGGAASNTIASGPSSSVVAHGRVHVDVLRFHHDLLKVGTVPCEEFVAFQFLRNH